MVQKIYTSAGPTVEHRQMAKTIDVSGAPIRAFQYMLVGSVAFGILFFVSLFCWTVLDAAEVAVPRPNVVVWPAVFAVVWATATVAWVRHVRRADDNPWVSVPGEQHLGRFVDHGGLARSSWARSIRDLSISAGEGERRDAEDGSGSGESGERCDERGDAESGERARRREREE
ncbi:hypothetical protein [Halosimplex sp. J119]